MLLCSFLLKGNPLLIDFVDCSVALQVHDGLFTFY